MARRAANVPFVIGAMDVNVTLEGVGISFLHPLQPEDTAQDEIIIRHLVRCPKAHRLARFENGTQGRIVPMLFLHHKATQRSFVAPLCVAQSEFRSAAWPAFDQMEALPEH